MEDDPGDQELVRRALNRDGFQADLRAVDAGETALDYLRERGRFAEPGAAPRPDLILLDLSLPGLPGKEVLGAVKSDPELRCTPVVVMATSARSRDIVDSYALGCNAYVIKPLEGERFITALREIYDFWFSWVALPGPRARARRRPRPERSEPAGT